MNLIDEQVQGVARASDYGLLERIEANPRASKYDFLALITRAADILERNDYLNDTLEDETWVAFDALDKLRGALSVQIGDDEMGVAVEMERMNAIRTYNDMNRYD